MFETISVPRRVIEGAPALAHPFDEQGARLTDVKACRELIKRYQAWLSERFAEGYAVGPLLDARTAFFDSLLSRLFLSFGLGADGTLAMLAVGGYGRAEMFPGSDIDILIVSSAEPIEASTQEKLESFISFLWDIKLDLGSSVRTVSDTLIEARGDITVRTNLLENHLIAGSGDVAELLLRRITQDNAWDPGRFLDAKVSEMRERYHQYKDTVYSIEPDVKNNPGGLRDLQVMQWIAALRFGAHDPSQMLQAGLLTEDEYSEFIECRAFLFEVRYALHLCARGSNRLTLDSQKSAAALLGYGSQGNAPVETMMRALFRTFRRVRELNEIVIQLETISIRGRLDGEDEPVFLNSVFVQRGKYIDVLDHDLFSDDPSMILELFRAIASRPAIKAIHVNCLKALRDARRALTSYLIELPQCRGIFKAVLTDPKAQAVALPLMHETRVLSAYMPQWERIEGLTQFDMFHMFSVDEHTIRVLTNLVTLQQRDEPIYSGFASVIRKLTEPGLLLVAAFLHDIAKGHGGHHAEEGAKIAYNFCQLHSFAPYQTELICWTIRSHLLFSITATRRDISDPEVISRFAAQLRDEEHLNMLYCLTVADVQATNEHEWNSWKDSIFRQLYLSVRQVLRGGRDGALDAGLKAQENQQLIIESSPEIKKSDLLRYFALFPTSYFIHYPPAEIRWHARNIVRFPKGDRPLILFAQLGPLGTELLVWYRSTSPTFFGSITAAMALKHLNVFSAQVFLTHHNHVLCTIKFQTRKNQPLDSDRLNSLRKSILAQLEDAGKDIELKRDSAHLFKVPTRISFLTDEGSGHTSFEVSTLDGEGLLAKIGIILGRCGCFISAARINTTGERADDFFTVTDVNGMPLGDSKKAELSQALHEALDEN